MQGLSYLKSALVGGASALALASPSSAKVFDIPTGDLAAALNSYIQQSGVHLIYMDESVRGHHTQGAKGNYTETAALNALLRGTGFTALTMPSNAIGIVPALDEPKPGAETIRVAAASPRASVVPQGVETVVVTAQHKSENIQQVPISITALSQAQLTDRQIAGGPDLLRDVPNMDFTKTNFSGYNIELRGIGTQAISVTTDPAVAVAFNDIPFIRNHFFEQEFFDLQDAEVLLGPQGTLYGRNATAGVVNLKSALPGDQYEAMLSADIGNYSNRRLEGMLNIPIVSDVLDIRFAGEWTKRSGYTENTTLNMPIDGRDLWSGRMTIGWKPSSDLQVDLVWEHFSEDDNRLRSGKQLCETAPTTEGGNGETFSPGNYLSQGCLPVSLYSKNAFEVPNGFSLPYYGGLTNGDAFLQKFFDPYSETTQSTNLRDIQSAINPGYKAKNDTIELNASYKLSPTLTLTSQTGFNQDFLWSTEDYNRFDTAPGAFVYEPYDGLTQPDPSGLMICTSSAAGYCGSATQGTPCTTGPGCQTAGEFCDPQLGCQDRLVLQDLDEEHAWQFSQEFRLASSFGGPFNFSTGANFLHYETEENYYVFINTLTQFDAYNTDAEGNGFGTYGINTSSCLPGPRYPNNNIGYGVLNGCEYIDPNPISSLNGEGHNYFLSKNPYMLNSYALFGEAYYNITHDLKLTAGLRWTDDQKHFIDIPSEVLVEYYGYPVAGTVDQQWQRLTGRSVLSWTPDLDFSDSSLFYASYSHGYKAGGANPPGAIYPGLGSFAGNSTIINPIHPLTFKPEYIEAFELGTKNTFFDSSLTLNGDVFYYNYSNYQISEIVDRTAINNNYNAHVEGAEVTANWEPIPGLKFNFAGGWEDTAAAAGDSGIDLMDRTAGMPGWTVVRPFVTNASNCILPTSVVNALLTESDGGAHAGSWGIPYACGNTYNLEVDPVTGLPYTPNPTAVLQSFPPFPSVPAGYPGFNPATAPNNGEGFDKNLTGHALPNAPPFTVSLGGEYSTPVSQDWVATLRSDFYYQADSWARIFNDNPYDRIHGYTNLNLALILTSANGWQVMGYVKNVFNITAITGDFLNSDDTGLTTNVFLTDPRLYGIRVTKHLDADDGFWGSDYSGADFFTDLFSDKDGGEPPLWIELGGGLDQLLSNNAQFTPSFMSAFTVPAQQKAFDVQQPPRFAFDENAKITYQPAGSSWIVSASIRFGRAAVSNDRHQQTKNANIHYDFLSPLNDEQKYGSLYPSRHVKVADGQARESESHAIVDFSVGKDVGLGFLGSSEGSSTISGGLRFVQFASKSNALLRGEPDVNYPNGPFTSFLELAHFLNANPPFKFHDYAASASTTRSFHGVGPSIKWDASLPVSGDQASGGLDMDWGLNGALLIGRQKARGHHQTTAKLYSLNEWQVTDAIGKGYDHIGHFVNNAVAGLGPVSVQNNPAKQFNRRRMVVVPNIGVFAGISYRYDNAKISFGYRADEFFGAMDGGIDTYKSENRGFFGPYANISIGLGG